MPEKERFLVQTRGYDIQLKIEDLDYTNDIDRIRIVSSINAPYQIIFIDLVLDQNDILAKKLYGQEPLKLRIRYLSRENNYGSLDDISFELMQLNDNSAARIKNTLSTETSKELSRVRLITVPRKPLKTISTFVNDVFSGKTIKQIIQELVSKNTNAKLVYDSEDTNDQPIEQLMIPPSTLYRTIKTLDDRYGIFNGASNLGFCQYDNSLQIFNLTKRMTKNQTFTIYHLSTDTKDIKDIVDKCNDGKNFYTLAPMVSMYNGNAVMSKVAKTITYNLKPIDGLYKTFTKDFKSICNSFGVNPKSGLEIFSDPMLDNREVYKITILGEQGTDTFINATNGRQVIGMANLKLELQKNLQVLNLLNIGEPVKVITKTAEYVEISGKYILKSSDILFTRETRDWMSFATINLCRTNKTI